MTSAAMKKVRRGGLCFTISVGYASLEHYAQVMRMNRDLLERNNRMDVQERDLLIHRYDREIARLKSVGI